MLRRNFNEECHMGKFAGRFRVMIAGCHGGESAATPGTVQTMQARVVESQEQQVPVSLRSTGTVHARETAVVSAQVMVRIQQVMVAKETASVLGRPWWFSTMRRCAHK